MGGLNGVIAKISYSGFSPIFVSIVAPRSAGSSCSPGAAIAASNPSRAMERYGGSSGGVLFGGEFVLIFIGLEFTSVARSTLLVNTMPFWVLIGAHFLLGERMTATKFAGLALAFCGLALVFPTGSATPAVHAGRRLMSSAAASSGRRPTLVIKRSSLKSTSAEKLLLYQLGMSLVVSFPLLFFTGPAIREPTGHTLLALMFQGVYIVGITYILWFWLMRRYPATGLSSFVFLTPVFGVLCGGLILGEPLTDIYSWRWR